MIHHHIRRNEHGQPVLTIRITGWHDMFRIAWVLCHAHVEFVAVGRAAFRHLARRLGKRTFASFDQRLTGGRVTRLGLHHRIRGDM